MTLRQPGAFRGSRYLLKKLSLAIVERPALRRFGKGGKICHRQIIAALLGHLYS